MVKAIQDFLFGLFFGCGFICAEGLRAIFLMILGSGHAIAAH